ncbi:MAG: glycosyltransferase family 39 protein [Flavobacteriales bacterium]|nr:glycosyltransferase family 39 protein [Flavobacteriales bacterium]MDW8432610.1 glycosyltransferase family 39 protein [Flavobacteriales bacterium]
MKTPKPWIWFLVGAALLWLPGLGAVPLFDWDEINFAEISREMVLSDNYLQPTINFRPFWEKPPLFFWLQAGCFRIFGISEWAARLPNVLCGMVTLLWMVRCGGARGALWALLYAGSLLPHLYFRSGILDPWYNLFGFWMFWYGLQALRETSSAAALKAGVAGGLALLTKGPAVPGVVVLTLGLHTLLTNSLFQLRRRPIWLGLAAFAVTGLSWYLAYGWRYGTEVLWDFLRYQWRLFSTPDAGHRGFPGFHVVVLFLGVMPATAYLGPALKSYRQPEVLPFALLTLMVVLVFSLVKTKIIHYSSLAYFPITWLAAWSLEKTLEVSIWGRRLATFQWLLLTLALGAAFVFFLKPETFLGWVQDPFARAHMAWAQPRWNFFMPLAWVAGIVTTIFYWKAASIRYLVRALVGGSLTLFLAIAAFTGPIAHISQGALLKICKEAAQENMPVYTLGFKSYAPFFYGQTKYPGWPEVDWHEGSPPGPALVVRKIHSSYTLPGCPDSVVAGGYVAYRCP